MKAFATLPILLSLSASAATVRLKDLADVQGVRDNQLIGYGLVVGLSGTGDTERTLFTNQSVSGMLGRLGVRIDPNDVRSRNVAAVMVTAKLPAFVRPGARIDATVGSLGNARSLAGGVLLLTPLRAADGVTYAVAQGAVQVGGFLAEAGGSSRQKNHPTTGAVPSGAIVERAVTVDLAKEPLLLGLKRPDFTTASRIALAIDAAIGKGTARAIDSAAVEVAIPDGYKQRPVALLAELEKLKVEADVRARVVVNERTGTVVAGEEVHLRPAAVAHGGLQISISRQPVISQPAPFSRRGATVQEQVTDVTADETSRSVVALPSTTTVDELARALNALGATPRDLIAILQALKVAGALDADLEVL